MNPKFSMNMMKISQNPVIFEEVFHPQKEKVKLYMGAENNYVYKKDQSFI